MVFSNFARQNPEDSPSAQIRKPYMRKTGIILAAAITICLCAASCGNRKGGKKVADEQKDSITMVQNSEPEFDIITTEGTIRVKLYSKTPRHRDNFCKLVSEHYYDSLLFHRVINGFMIQTGDPYTRDSSKAELYGQGGPDYTIPAEFVNEYYHKKGALAAARRGDTANPRRSSSGSQFYIVQDEMNCIHLDGQYTVFGETIDGLDVIDRIASAPTDRRDRPVKDIRIITIKPVEIQIKTVSDSTDVQSADSTTTVDSLAEEKKVKE